MQKPFLEDRHPCMRLQLIHNPHTVSMSRVHWPPIRQRHLCFSLLTYRTGVIYHALKCIHNKCKHMRRSLSTSNIQAIRQDTLPMPDTQATLLTPIPHMHGNRNRHTPNAMAICWQWPSLL